MTKPDVWSERLASGWIYWPACLLGLALVSLAVLGPEAERNLDVKLQGAAMQAEVQALTETRDREVAVEQALKDDPMIIERVVRHELGLVRPGEIRLPQRVNPQAVHAAAPRPDVSPALLALALFGDAKLQFLAMVIGATLLASAILFSLPGKKTVQSSK
jgi:cell division protein FtsB